MSVEQKKIALMGTSSVGKTRILEEARKQFPEAYCVPEAAREFFRNNRVEDRFSAETQGKIQEIALRNELKARESGARVIICDRSVLDAVVYTRKHGDLEGSEELYERVRSWLVTYYKFLLLDPLDVPYKQNEVRTESEEKRNNFHKVFIEFFEEKGIPFELLSGTVKERIKRLKEIIDE